MRSLPLFAIIAAVLFFGTPRSALADDPGTTPPNGYHLESATNWPLIGVGIGVLALSGLSFVGAVEANRQSSKTDRNEVLGPVLSLAGVLLVLGGLGLVTAGVVHPRQKVVPDASAQWFAFPVVARGGAGFAAGVAF